MRNTLLSIFLGLICFVPMCLVGQAIPQSPFKPKKIKLKGHQPDSEIVVDSGYDPNLLVPHFDQKSQKWGYIHRTTKRLVVPHQFDDAGLSFNQTAYAIKISDLRGFDVYRIQDDGTIHQILKDTFNLLVRDHSQDNYTYLFDDGYFYVKLGKHLTIFSPEETQIDTVAPINGSPCWHGEPFLYFGNGNMLLNYGDAMVFLNFEKHQFISYEISRYSFPDLRWLEKDYAHSFTHCDIQRKIDGKIGLIDQFGNLAVDFVWDTIPKIWVQGKDLYSNSSQEELHDAYIPNKDSIYLAFKGNRPVWAHLDGHTVYEFPENAIAFSPQFGFWKAQNLFQIGTFQSDSTILYSLLNPKTGELSLQSTQPIQILSNNIVQTIEEEIDGEGNTRQIAKYFFAPKFQNPKIEMFGKNRIVTESYLFNGRYYLIIKNLVKNEYQLQDEDGNILIEKSWWPMAFNQYTVDDRYPIIVTKSYSKPYATIFNSVYGEKLFGNEVLDSEDNLQNKTTLRFDNQNIPKILSYYIHLNTYDRPYPNRFLVVSQYNKKGKKIGTGFIDIYGQVYF